MSRPCSLTDTVPVNEIRLLNEVIDGDTLNCASDSVYM